MNEPKAAIVGVGLSEVSRRSIGTSRKLAVDAIVSACEDAGLPLSSLDGLLLTRSPSAPRDNLPPTVQNDLGLHGLRVLCGIDGEGASSVLAVQHAVHLLQAGMASAVACVFADARVTGSGAASGFAQAMPLTGIAGWEAQYGLFGPVGAYGLATRRYIACTGITEKDLGAYVIACREWARLNPSAMLRTPLSLADYLASPWVVEPLRRHDCAFPVNGAIAVVLTRAERAASLKRPPVYVYGMGQASDANRSLSGSGGFACGAARAAADDAARMAGISVTDIGMCQLYDPFSSAGLMLLEAYGLCPPGAAGPFVRDGHTSPGGRLPVNTGGGHLSGHYLQGMTPVAEATIQARGEAGERQVPGSKPILVGGMGGVFNYHATLVLGGKACCP